MIDREWEKRKEKGDNDEENIWRKKQIKMMLMMIVSRDLLIFLLNLPLLYKRVALVKQSRIIAPIKELNK